MRKKMRISEQMLKLLDDYKNKWNATRTPKEKYILKNDVYNFKEIYEEEVVDYFWMYITGQCSIQ